MPLTQSINSKSNIKKLTNSDLPANLNQPVINSYYATSTASQTVINLSFTVDTTSSGYTDNFWLFVDGKKLRLGSSHDYTFTSVASDGTSSQVTLTAAISANLNIQAYKLGLKPEVQFGMDNRFVQLYAAQDAGFQAFIDNSSYLISATTTAGSPAAGTFYSSITKRASITDLSQDLKPRMGIDRLIVQQVYEIQNEFGSSGEKVFGVLNDDKGLIRFVGSWSNNITSSGQFMSSSTSGDFIEITFYGTGLNLLADLASASMDIRPSIDGGSEAANIFAASYSSALDTRNYSTNQVLPVYSAQTLGVHTVKLRNNSTNAVKIYGFEILNESSSVKVTSGYAYLKNQQYVASSLQSFSYNTSVTGTKGGRTLTYLKSDGTLGQAFQAANASAAYMSSADHTNEEIARRYHFREFGAGRTDDFSTMAVASGSTNRAFTLDDGSTALVASAVDNGSTLNEYLRLANANSFVIFTFVGTGVDYVIANLSGTVADNVQIYIDGTNVGNVTGLSRSAQTRKIASGLPYGTHTLKIANLSPSPTNTEHLHSFIVYQPKKPSLPSGAVELADYNVMANYVANSTAGIDTIGAGVLRKFCTRELTYINGTGGSFDWSMAGAIAATTFIGGVNITTDRSSAYSEYTFFGTGFEMRFRATSGRSASISVALNGLAATTINYPTLTASVYGTGVTFSSGVLDQLDASDTPGSGLSINNLPLGLYKVRFTNNTASSVLDVNTIDIITPIHSHKSNLYGNLQNTLPVGSNAISDNRKLTPVKEAFAFQKYHASAFPITSDPTTTSTTPVPCPDMSLTVNSNGSWFLINYYALINASTSTASWVGIFINGNYAVVPSNAQNSPGALRDATGYAASNTIPMFLPKGTHKIDLYWAAGSATTLTAVGLRRMISITEL